MRSKADETLVIVDTQFCKSKIKMYDSAQSFDLVGLMRYVKNINDKTSSISYLSLTFAAVA